MTAKGMERGLFALPYKIIVVQLLLSWQISFETNIDEINGEKTVRICRVVLAVDLNNLHAIAKIGGVIKFKRLGKIVGVAVLMYVFLMTIIWFGIWYTANDAFSRPLANYAKKHSEEIKQKIFGTLFTQAKDCLTLKTDDEKRECQKDISHELALIIIEEEFSYQGNTYWPHDLYFVKYQNGKYTALGWGGVLEDTKVVNEPNSEIDYWHYKLRQSLGRCRFFDYLQPEGVVCQVYQSFDLGNGDKGYMVRHISLNDEDIDWFLNLIIPMIALVGFIEGDLPYQSGIAALSIFSIPLLSIIIAMLVDRKNQQKTH